MNDDLTKFEQIVRRSHQFTDVPTTRSEHPFGSRNIHSDLPISVRNLFDHGHFAQATFEALKFLDEEVQKITGNSNHGKQLMMQVFGGNPPPLPLNPGTSNSDHDEQEGFKFLFAGAIQGIRNPRAHSTSIIDDPDICLDYLGLSSLLLRRLDEAGLRTAISNQ